MGQAIDPIQHQCPPSAVTVSVIPDHQLDSVEVVKHNITEVGYTGGLTDFIDSGSADICEYHPLFTYCSLLLYQTHICSILTIIQVLHCNSWCNIT